MQLTQFTDYSLRALIYIALKNDICTIKDISEAYDISGNHLNKIIHNLARLGLIRTIRGKHGGVILEPSALERHLGSLILKLESHFDLVPCFNQDKERCCISAVCKLKQVLYEAREAFMAVLNQCTLADIVHNQSELSALLRIPWRLI